MNYTIFMLKKNDQTTMKRMGYRWNMAHGGVDVNEYDAVYNGSIEPLESIPATLEAIYVAFNTGSTPGYFGRSMSVSDLVTLEGVGTFFCDSVGFKQIDAR